MCYLFVLFFNFFRSIVEQLPLSFRTCVTVVELKPGISLEELEKEVFDTTHALFLLTEHILDQREGKFVLHSIIDCNILVRLIHHATTCTFPVPSDSVKLAFEGKAITHIECKSFKIIFDIKIRSVHRENCFLSNKIFQVEILVPRTAGRVSQVLFLSCFLLVILFFSHKRETGQTIAARLWENLHSNYSVFLDSEAQFDLHDLEELVKKTSRTKKRFF